MKIQCFDKNYDTSIIKNNFKKQEKTINTYKNLPLSNHCYKPFFGSNENFEKNLNIHQKPLRTKDFQPEEKTIKEMNIAEFDKNTILSEHIYKNIPSEKIKNKNSIIKCSVQEPTSLAQLPTKNVLTETFINFSDGLLKYPSVASTELSTKQNLIKAFHKEKISKEELEDIQNAKPSSKIKKLLDSNSIDKNTKKFIWELTEIPFFNAATDNLREEQLMAMIRVFENKKDRIFWTEMLKGNIIIQNTYTQESRPILNLKNIAINNRFNPIYKISLYNDVVLKYNELLEHTRFHCQFIKEASGKYPLLFYSNDIEGKTIPLVNIKGNIESIQNNEDKPPYTIIFKNDVNQISEESLLTEEEQEKLFNAKLTPTPKSFMNYLQNPDHSLSQKRIAYNLSENPYINALMKDSKECDVADLVFLKQNYSKIFENMLSGKIKIIGSHNEYKLNPLIDLEELILSNKKLNKIMSYGTFNYDLCQKLGEYKKQYGKDVVLVNYKKQSDKICTTLKLSDDRVETIYEDKALPNSMKKYLPNNSCQFTIYLVPEMLL